MNSGLLQEAGWDVLDFWCGLTTDAKQSQSVRAAIRHRRLCGPASIEYVKSLKPLPYAEGMVDLLVADLDAPRGDVPDQDGSVVCLGK